MATYNSPSIKYLPKALIKLIKTSAAIGLKSVSYQHDYLADTHPALAKGLPEGIRCVSFTDHLRSKTTWEATWP